MESPLMTMSTMGWGLNAALGSLILAGSALVVADACRRCSKLFRYGVLLSAILATLVSPFAISISSALGRGLISIVPSVESVKRDNGNASQPLAISNPSDDAWLSPGIPAASMAKSGQQPTVSVTVPTRDRKPVESSSASSSSAEPAGFQRTDSVGMWRMLELVCLCLIVIWLSVTAWLLARMFQGMLVLRRLRRTLRPISDVRLSQGTPSFWTSCLSGLPVYESDLAPAPLVLGWRRPLIVMPTRLCDQLNDDELAGVLTHEAAHAARKDVLVSLLEHLTLAMYWWNPFLRGIHRRMNYLREQMCDDRVLERGGKGLSLASALVKVAEWSVDRWISVGWTATLLDDRHDLELRVVRLIDGEGDRLPRPNWQSRAAIVVLEIFLLLPGMIPILRLEADDARNGVAAAVDDADQVVLSVRGTDPEGRLIEDSRVGLMLDPFQAVQWQEPGTDGVTKITSLPRLPKYVYVMVRAPGYAPLRAFWRNGKDILPDPLPEEMEFRMTRAITVGGRVVDEEDRPIAGATVLFSADGNRSSAAERVEVGFWKEELKTDEAGEWRCDLAPEDIQSATMSVHHAEYAQTVIQNLSQDARIPELRELTHRWVLKKGFHLVGRVTDEDGDPIVGAKLVLSELNSISSDGPFAVTNEQGDYSFERVSPFYEGVNASQGNRFLVTVVKPGYGPEQERVPGFGGRPLEDSTSERRVADVMLNRGVTVSLKVLDSQNRPVVGARVFPDGWQGTRVLLGLESAVIPKKTDDDGVWTWGAAPTSGRIEFCINHPDFAYFRRWWTLSDDGIEEAVVLSRPQVIVGKVIDAETREPIEEFIVEQAFENRHDYPDGLYWISTKTRGTNGIYRHRPPLPPQTDRKSYSYRAVAKGYEPAEPQSIEYEEGETEVNFELNRASPD